ncbi:hypothetical protein D0T12_04315 [Actinomadura spongiicola]|uniref:Uncharacterized protein n=1 Tax=Actinomadura spongiicola TaxID=2303421 RepID=A0A372GQN3_9ACTN|nr:hypothetical protein [Actinomadura spongiicola]RFS87452.1 hypothetical protein D0T12_04315 [Actinomadura spongiicola]
MLTVRQSSDAVAVPDRERLGVAFRVLLVLRGLVLAMTVMLVPDDWHDPSLMLAVVAVATVTAIACLAWRGVLSLYYGIRRRDRTGGRGPGNGPASRRRPGSRAARQAATRRRRARLRPTPG